MIPWVMRNPKGGWGIGDGYGIVSGQYSTESRAFNKLNQRMMKRMANDKRIQEMLLKSGGQTTWQPQKTTVTNQP